MVETIKDIDSSNLCTNAVLVSFDVVNMFPNTDDNMGIASFR